MNGSGFVSRLRAFAQQPFTTPMDLLDVTLLTILVATVAVLWTRVLKHIVTE